LTLFAPPLLYLAGTAAYAAHFARGARATGWLATAALASGAGLHLVALLGGGQGVLRCPVTTEAGFLSLFALSVVLVYVPLEGLFRNRAFGLFMAPLAAAFYATAVLLDTRAGAAAEPPLELFASAWFSAHVLSTLVAYAAFTFSATTALMLVLLQRTLARADMGLVFQRFPDLGTLDRMTHRGVQIGWPALSIGLLSGALWAAGEARGVWLTDPKTIVAACAWVTYAAYLLSRPLLGWQGPRSAWTSLVGFAVVLATHIGAGPLASGFHSFR